LVVLLILGYVGGIAVRCQQTLTPLTFEDIAELKWQLTNIVAEKVHRTILLVIWGLEPKNKGRRGLIQ